MKECNWEQTIKQEEAWQCLLDDMTTELLFGGGAGGGKSRLGVSWIILMCGMYPETRWLIGRKKLKRLKETPLRTFFQVCREWGLKAGVDYKYNSSDSIITFRGGAEILLKDLAHQPSDPEYDELGSLELTGGFVDEVGQISFKCWSILTSRIRYNLDKYGLTPKLLGSCNPTKEWPYSEFYKPDKDGKLETHKKFIKALAADNKFLSSSYITQLTKIKDKATRERLLNGNWEYDDDPSILFSFEVIQDLFTTKVEDKSNRFITGDVSRKGRDNMPIGLWHGLQLIKVAMIPYEIRSSTKKSAEWIMKFAQKHNVRFSHIVLDEDGVGGGVVDNIPGCIGFLNGSSAFLTKDEKRRKAKGEYYINFGNLKTQCYFKMAELAEAGEIGINEDAFASDEDKQDFIEEMGQVKQRDTDKDGTVYLVDKKTVKQNIGRSPDFSDMAMMRMRFIVKPRVAIDIIDL